jgi:gamma-glutamyltranspeptidase
MENDTKYAEYSKILKQLTKVGDEYTYNGRIPDAYEEYFKKNGCITQEFDFGTITTLITRFKLVN